MGISLFLLSLQINPSIAQTHGWDEFLILICVFRAVVKFARLYWVSWTSTLWLALTLEIWLKLNRFFSLRSQQQTRLLQRRRKQLLCGPLREITDEGCSIKNVFFKTSTKSLFNTGCVHKQPKTLKGEAAYRLWSKLSLFFMNYFNAFQNYNFILPDKFVSWHSVGHSSVEK